MMAEVLTSAILTAGAMSFPHVDLVPKDFDANLKFRRSMLEMAGSDRSAAAQIKTMCAEDVLFYINTFCWTYSPKENKLAPVVPFITYEYQDEAVVGLLECIYEGQDAAVLKSRDMGASWLGAIVIESCWHFKDFQSFLIVSRKQELVDNAGDPVSLFWKIDFLHKNQPRWLLPSGRWLGRKDPNRIQMHLGNADNGSVIDGESTTGNLGVGDRRTAMFIDEFGAFETQDGYAVVQGTRDVTDCRIFNSTPRGRNAFYEISERPAVRKIRMHWSRHPIKAQGLYRGNKDTGKIELLSDFTGMVRVQPKGEERSRMVAFPEKYPFRCDGKTRSPWYDHQCDRALTPQEIARELDIDFAGSDYGFFDPETIEILTKKYCREPIVVGDLEFNPETLEPKRFVENPKGKLLLWIDLRDRARPASDRKFALGADVSAGTGASNSIDSIVDLQTGEKVGLWRDSNTRPNPFAKQSIALAKWFNNAFMAWDASGPTGEVFTKRVIKSGYGNVYYRKNVKKVTQKQTDEPGYYLNPEARTSLLEDYREILGDHQFINRSKSGMDECLQFIRKVDGTIEHSASITSQDPSGARTAHGDEVIADALAALSITTKIDEEQAKKPEVPVGCLAYRMKQKEMQMAAASADCLKEGW